MDAVEGLFKVNEVDVELSLPLSTLFYNISEYENLVSTSRSLAESCLFFPESTVTGF